MVEKQLFLDIVAAISDQLAGPLCNGRDGGSRMPTDLLRKDAGINHSDTSHSVHTASQVDHAVGRRWAHSGCSHGMVQRKSPLYEILAQLLISDGVNVTAGIWPPIRGRVVICWDRIKILLKSWATHDSETETQSRHHHFFVVIVLVREVLGINDG